MGGKKTEDGIKLEAIVRFAEQMGLTVRAGRKHPYVLTYPGYKTCSVATSSDVKDAIVPWLRKVIKDRYPGRKDYDNNHKIYLALKQGKF